MCVLLLLLIAVFTASACGEPKLPIKGIITDKQHVEASSSTVLMPQYTTICSGNSPVCTPRLIGMIPIISNEPKKWALAIQKDSEASAEAIEVPHETYIRAMIGQYYDQATDALR